MISRTPLRNGKVPPVTLEHRYELANDWYKTTGEKIKPDSVNLYYHTNHWAKAGRCPTSGGARRYSLTFFDDDWGIEDWLERRYLQTCIRKSYVEERPNRESLEHHSIQKGAPRALTYAVGLGNGIKVGKSGTGDNELVLQLTSRISQYRSTHEIEVIGICDHIFYDIDEIEADLHKQLADYKLSYGDEMFKNCAEVRDILWEFYRNAWHQDRPLDLLRERKDYYYEIGNSPFHNLKGKTHHFAFDWRDYVRLAEEIELVITAGEYEYYDELVKIVNKHREEKGLPCFGESETDSLYADLLDIYLPKEESLYPRARKMLDKFVRSNCGSGIWEVI